MPKAHLSSRPERVKVTTGCCWADVAFLFLFLPGENDSHFPKPREEKGKRHQPNSNLLSLSPNTVFGLSVGVTHTHNNIFPWSEQGLIAIRGVRTMFSSPLGRISVV